MEFLFIIIGGFGLLWLFVFLKHQIWDKPREEIDQLKKQLHNTEKECQKAKTDFLNQCEKEKEAYTTEQRRKCFAEIQRIQRECQQRIEAIEDDNEHLRTEYHKIYTTLEIFKSNMTSIPYMAGMIADIETYGLEALAQGLSWGKSERRLEKVKSIREIRNDARAMVEKNKEAQYQLAYLLAMYPVLSDVIECEYDKLPAVEVNALSEYDAARDYLSKEEYMALSPAERNQLALDRYMNSHKKTKWQIGRDYEHYVSYQYSQKGYDVDNFGSYMGIEDLGRDIIAKKDNTTLIIQCKYWSSLKEIHEKHITQLYGTMICYCIENGLDQSAIKGVLVTNIRLSKMAKQMADLLGIKYSENYAMGSYPCIKCNIGRNEFGLTKIYHLPFDQQYDATKIKNSGEFYAMTVEEAESAGFRRTFKWHGYQ